MTDRGLTYAVLAQLPIGSTVHFTNWPGRASKPAKLLSHRGLIRLEDANHDMQAFPDELSLAPRNGLGE